METRQVTEVRVYYLILNPVTGKANDRKIAAMSYDREKLEYWVDMLKEPESYKDGGFLKRFRKDSPLEMFNSWIGSGLGILDDWVPIERFESYRIMHNEIPFIE